MNLIAEAMSGVEMGLKIAVEQLHSAFNGWSRHINQCTKSLSSIEGKDFA